MVAAPPALRDAADVARDIRAETTAASSSVDALRADLAAAVSSATRGSSENDEAAFGASGDREDADARSLVARFRAMNDAREMLARVTRAEAALHDASASTRSTHPSTATPADLGRLREASVTLLGAARSLRDALDADDVHDEGKGKGKDGIASGKDPRRKPDPNDAAVRARFAGSLAIRLAVECDRLRDVAGKLAVDAAGRTGWPPAINPAAVDAFEWAIDPETGDEAGSAAGDLLEACAAIASLQAASEACDECVDDVNNNDADAVSTSPSWIAEALATPLRDAIARHFTGDGAASDPHRPERLFACASTLTNRLSPIFANALSGYLSGYLTATGDDDGSRSSITSRSSTSPTTSAASLARGLALAISRGVGDVIEGHSAPAIELAEEEDAYVGARAYSRDDARRADTRWLHLADECERYDAALRKLLVPGSNPGWKGNSTVEIPAGCSATGRLASSSRDRAGRWMRAELADCVREIESVAMGARGWSPSAVGVGYEEGEPDPALDGVEGDEVDEANEDGQLCFPPVAEKVVECFTRSVDRAMSIPRRCVVPDNSHEGWDSGSPMYEPEMGARVAYLANVSAETINEFVSKTLTPRVKGTDSYHAMIASASGRSARGAVHVGNCVAVARRIASALRERGESDAGLLALGPDLFRDQAVCLDAFVDEWTGKIADTCVDAFNRSAAMYFGGVHLMERFGKDRDKLTPGGDGDGEAKKQDSRGDGADADASPLLLNPLGVLRDGLNVIRAALIAADGTNDGASSCVQAATRRAASAVSKLLVAEVVYCASFTELGAVRFQRDVDAIAGAFGVHLRRAGNYLGPVRECAVLLRLDVSVARVFAAAVDASLSREASNSNDGGFKGGTNTNAGGDDARAVERLREDHGVHRLTDAQIARVLSRRRDMGRGG